MEIRHLRYFVAVAEEGSVTKAAIRLGMQQPPLGQQIRALEAEIGVVLFDRAPKRIRLNAAGEVFLQSALRILSDVDNAVQYVRRFNAGERGRLTVGMTSSTSLHPLTPKILRAFRRKYPLVQIEVQESETYELILALQQRRIDVAFVHIAARRFTELQSDTLTKEDLVVAIPSDHPLARQPKKPLTLRALSEHSFVVFRRADGPGIFDGISAAFERAGLKLKIADDVRRLVAAVNLVAAGRGITIVPSTIEVLHRDSIVFRPLAKAALPPLPFNVVYGKANELALLRNFVAVTTGLAARVESRFGH